MKKNGTKKTGPVLPAGIVAVKLPKKEREKFEKWIADEPASLTSGGRNVRFRQSAKN